MTGKWRVRVTCRECGWHGPNAFKTMLGTRVLTFLRCCPGCGHAAGNETFRLAVWRPVYYWWAPWTWFYPEWECRPGTLVAQEGKYECSS